MHEVNTSRTVRRNRRAAFITDRRGATAVEFAMVAAPFLALVVALIQTFVVFFAQGVLEQVVQQAGRQIMTGQVQNAQMTQSAFQQVVCNQTKILFNCSGLMVDVQVAASWSSTNTTAPTLTYNAQGQVTNTWQFNPGTAGNIVIVRVMYLWPVVGGPLAFSLSNQPNGSRMIMSTAAFQNEPSS
ncbi:pilus assembly protein [Bradyrhizobium jicamae]|uniref:Pilus assembly protein n=1 Tax=Bradyrhizobium jicamae TaxID=280332 RepID=A0ABS5FF05_9BRAD|nr:TadE/TadG family type IV pilus assembly protein [Bradyrhizobium jicamae]MBR0795382.1 pilus assembly protein [Bradyrhizobium jicamae]MBR0932804.1 pilus assembly protein [Bradyrhizobium jicamae]